MTVPRDKNRIWVSDLFPSSAFSLTSLAHGVPCAEAPHQALQRRAPGAKWPLWNVSSVSRCRGRTQDCNSRWRRRGFAVPGSVAGAAQLGPPHENPASSLHSWQGSLPSKPRPPSVRRLRALEQAPTSPLGHSLLRMRGCFCLCLCPQTGLLLAWLTSDKASLAAHW